MHSEHSPGNQYGHPYIVIPAGAQPPRNPSQRQFTPQSSPYPFETASPPFNNTNSPQIQDSPLDYFAAQRRSAAEFPLLPRSKTASLVEARSGLMIPESELHRFSSQRTGVHSAVASCHRATRSDVALGSVDHLRNDHSVTSLASEEYEPDDYPAEVYLLSLGTPGMLICPGSQRMTCLVNSPICRALISSLPRTDLVPITQRGSLDSEESLRRFQAGELPEIDQQWHRLVPFEAREALGKQEVQRQSVLFEVFTSEREYVADLEAVREVNVADSLAIAHNINICSGLCRAV
jgi:RHO1 GDP-GTP exchange protein 1/2